MTQKKAVTVWDVDDVFFPLNEHVARIARVDYNKIMTYKAMDNPVLSLEERTRLYKAYTTPGLHRSMDFYPEARQFGILARDAHLEPWICSNSVDEIVIANKRRNLAEYLGSDWTLFQQMFNIMGMENSHVKRFPDNIWLLFDDSPLNAVASNAKHVLMPRRPWNQSDWGQGVLAQIQNRVQYYDNIPEACCMARDLINLELGPPIA